MKNKNYYDDPPPELPPEPEIKSFSQDDVDKIVQNRLAKSKAQQQKLVDQLEVLKQNQNLTTEQAASLQSEIDELKSTLMTKDELSAQERKKLQTQLESERSNLTSERDTWKAKFTTSTIQRAITDAAVTAGATRAQLLVDILQNRTRLVELKDENGKPTGEFAVHSKIEGLNEEGKAIILDLPIGEAVPKMKEWTSLYGSLFHETKTGGVGGNNVSGNSETFDPTKIKSFEEYKKVRDKLIS